MTIIFIQCRWIPQILSKLLDLLIFKNEKWFLVCQSPHFPLRHAAVYSAGLVAQRSIEDIEKTWLPINSTHSV